MIGISSSRMAGGSSGRTRVMRRSSVFLNTIRSDYRKLRPMPTIRLAVVAALALVSAAHHATAQTAVERELIQLERDWDAAFFRNDTAFIDRVLAPSSWPRIRTAHAATAPRSWPTPPPSTSRSNRPRSTSSPCRSTETRRSCGSRRRLVGTEQGQAARGRAPVPGRVRAPRRPLAVRGDAERQGAGVRSADRGVRMRIARVLAVAVVMAAAWPGRCRCAAQAPARRPRRVNRRAR